MQKSQSIADKSSRYERMRNQATVDLSTSHNQIIEEDDQAA